MKSVTKILFGLALALVLSGTGVFDQTAAQQIAEQQELLEEVSYLELGDKQKAELENDS
jgi:outer membrane lipoprotein-sorting protein